VVVLRHTPLLVVAAAALAVILLLVLFQLVAGLHTPLPWAQAATTLLWLALELVQLQPEAVLEVLVTPARVTAAALAVVVLAVL
jgi:hypothetical protein